MKLSDKAQVTREKILVAASELFFIYGYHATGLDKIIKAAGVTKGNFYYYFKSKEALAVEALEWHFKQSMEQATEILLGQQASPLQALFSLLELMSARQKAQQYEGRICGCFFGNLTLELSGESRAVRRKVKEVFDQFIQSFASLLAAARDLGEVSQYIEPEKTAVMILSQMEGAILLDKANQQTLNVDNSIEFIRGYLAT